MTATGERLARLSAPALDEILGQVFPVLDDGFVRVIDYMGTDAAIVQAARVSYGAGTKMVSEDRGLIRYLLRHRHTTPFEMCELKLHVRVPMDCWRQWIRHRSANVNEYSTRYSIAIDGAQTTKADEWRTQAAENKQGSGDFLDSSIGSALSEQEREFQVKARELYDQRLSAGVAREQARKDLPLSTYTEAYWKVDLHNLLHFLALRMDAHAQSEIRAFATVIGEEIVKRWCPLAWEAFQDYRFQGQSLSAIETAVIAAVGGGNPQQAVAIATERGLLSYADGKPKRNRERSELEAKLRTFNMAIPWETTQG
jgi:thymidylate synthase (FAD)